MAKICLPPSITKKFLQGIKNGDIDIAKLSEMKDGVERRSFFKESLGISDVQAKEINSLFESKLLLKNQEQGMITWIKSIGGLDKKVVNDLVSRVQKMDKILSLAEQDTFLNDLAGKKLGADISGEELQQLSELSNKFTEAESKLNADKETFSTEEDRLNYGRAKVKLEDFVNEIKTETTKLKIEDFKTSPIKSIKRSVIDFAGLTKSLKASFDNSVIGRQGLKVLFTSPKIWLKNAKQSFVDMYNTFGGKNVMDEVRADVLSRPNAINGLYKKEKLAVGVTEEAYPTNLPERIPYLGRAFKASESAFTGFQYRTRADIFDKYVEIAKESGADITGIGKIANALTGRGTLGPFEGSAEALNNIFFSPRMLKSNIDTLTGHSLQGGISPFARKIAAVNLVKIVSGIAAILAIAKAVNPKSVETDPRSSDFGKIKIGDTRFDISGGMSGLVTLASRLASKSYKSSTTGKITPLDSGKYGALTTTDVITNFMTNKLAPVASVANDMLIRGTDFKGNKPTILGEVKNLLVPLPITNYEELRKDPKSANIIAAMIADALGISVNTYGNQSKKSTKLKGN